MGGELVEFVGDPRGRRYTEQDKEGAYLIWRNAANRSLRRTAELAGVNHNTIGTWSQEHGWTGRAAKEDAADAATMRRVVSTLVVGEVAKSIETAKEIRDDPTKSGRDRLEAAKWLAGIAGVGAVSKIEHDITHLPEPDQPKNEFDEDLSKLSDDELMERELAYRARKRTA